MMDCKNTCPNCFKTISSNSMCPYCHYDLANRKKYSGVLPEFTILYNRYLIGRILGRGGFGVTYLALNINKNTVCAIKEYMPSEYSKRSSNTLNIEPFPDTKSRNVFSHGREKFVEEARTLQRLRNNPVVVDILDFFTENNTAYLVMEYLDGLDLRKKSRLSGGKLNVDFANQVFLTIASALMDVHSHNILHRDLSPENIIVTSDNRIKLIDFGAARNYVSLQNKGMSILLKPGFAPPEQYNTKGHQGPWSDVYSLCATYYNIVSGKQLVDALYRYRGTPQPSLKSLGCNVSEKISDVIEKGLELDYKRRYKNFKELLDALSPPKFPEQPSKPPITPAPPQPYIARISGTSIYGKAFVSRTNKTYIGRLPSCNYIVNDNSRVISKEHCYIRYDGTDIYICDISANGTYFENGNRLIKNKEYRIKMGTKFYLVTKKHMFVIDA